MPQIPCTGVKPILFAAPSPGAKDDANNKYDTGETITQIRQQNAVIQTLCKK